MSSYKIIELISNYVFKIYYKDEILDYINKVLPNMLDRYFNEEFKNQNKDMEIHKIIGSALKEIITQRRKIILTLKHFNRTDLNQNIGELVQLRNTLGAHSNLGEKEISAEQANSCRNLSRILILELLEGKTIPKQGL